MPMFPFLSGMAIGLLCGVVVAGYIFIYMIDHRRDEP